MNFLKDGYIIANKYKIERVLEDTEFSNIYIGSYKDKEIIIKECFPSGLVLRDKNNEVFTQKNIKKFELVKKSFILEGKLLKEIENDSIVKLYDFIEENNTVYLILEYCKGVTLKKYIENDDLREEEILIIFNKIIDIIEFLHKNSIIHRDIKPSNILIENMGNIKLIDFGSAIRKKYKNGEYVKVTEGYSPLEMYVLKTEIDERTDIYSLSALLYFMLNKQKPMSALQRFYYPELLYEENISEFLKKIIQKGLEMNGKDRYKSVIEMKEELERGRA